MKWGICWEANKKHAQAEHSTSMTFRSTSLGTDPHMPADLLKSFSCIFCWKMLSWHLSCRPGQSSNSSVPAVAEPYELLSVCSPHVNHWALNTPYNQGHRDLEGRRPLWSGCYLTSISLFFFFLAFAPYSEYSFSWLFVFNTFKSPPLLQIHSGVSGAKWHTVPFKTFKKICSLIQREHFNEVNDQTERSLHKTEVPWSQV
jgi:hypothetical protein